jgi:ABC-type spermidine/putrescine transport system permease subunit II
LASSPSLTFETQANIAVIRAISLVYGCYLLLPIALLVLGSFGNNWTNSLLPSGMTTRWYAELWLDPSFRKAFVSSLVVALSACAINTLVAVPLAYALHHTDKSSNHMRPSIAPWKRPRSA